MMQLSDTRTREKNGERSSESEHGPLTSHVLKAKVDDLAHELAMFRAQGPNLAPIYSLGHTSQFRASLREGISFSKWPCVGSLVSQPCFRSLGKHSFAPRCPGRVAQELLLRTAKVLSSLVLRPMWC